MKLKITMDERIMLFIRGLIILALVMVLGMDILLAKKVDISFVCFCLLTLYAISS